MSAQDDVPRFDDHLKAGLAALANIFFVCVVVVIWRVEGPLFGGHQLTGIAPYLFILGASILIVYYAGLAASDKFGVLIDMLVRAARNGIVEEDDHHGKARRSSTKRFQRFWTNL
jgi:hypothetical protein